jgi:PAS domain S-box-containing protein
MFPRSSSIAARYAFTILAVTLATLLRFALIPILGEGVPFILYYPTVVLCAWFGGLWPGLVSAALGGFISWYVFIPPQYSFTVSDPTAPAQLIVFLLAGTLISLLAESLHQAKRRTEESKTREQEQRERLRVTLASIGDAMIATDAQGRVTFMNQVAESLTGWKHEEASGRPLEDVFNIVDEQTHKQVENPALRAMKEGIIVGLANHTLLIAKGGAEIPIDDSGAPIKDSEGKTVGAVLIFRDITQRRRAEKERALLAGIVESSEDAVISKSLNGVIESWNAAAERLFGYSANEAIGQPISIIIPPERIEEEQLILERLRRGEGIEHFETVRLAKSGRAVDISLTVSPIRDNTGCIIGFSKIARDITERRRAEEALQQQREWLRVTLASIGDAVIATDTNDAITFLNPIAESLTGWKQEEAQGQSIEKVFNIVNEQTRKTVENPALRAMKEGIIVGLANHTVLIAKDGTEISIDDSGAPIKNSEGKTLGAVLIFRDITGRRRAEKERAELLVSEQVARAQAEKAAEIIRRLQYVTDVALQRLTLDDLLHEILSRVRDLLMVDSVTILLLTDDERHLTARATIGLDGELAREVPVLFGQGVVGRIAASRSPLVIEDISKVEVVRSTLRENICSMIGTPLLIEGRVIGVIHADTIKPRQFTEDDVRLLQLVADRIASAIDRARLYEAERNARKQAEYANRAKDEFLATVSHELRTPLNAMLGWARLLRSGKLNDASSIRAIETIERNAKAQAQLIDDLLDISRIISGKLLIETRLVEPIPVIEAAISAVRPAADAKGIRFHVVLEAEAGPIYGDPTRLQQIVWNLLLNAVKFTQSEGVVEVRLERVDPNVEITVSDSGQGISPDFLPYVFDRFRQADDPNTRKHGGLGLGLAIVRHLVELHGGTIQAESPGIGRGATFKVRLPLITIKIEPVDSEAKQWESGVERSRLFDRQISLNGLQILVVEDEKDSREMVAFVLEQCRAEVRMAASAAEALDILDKWQPDVLISDISMPEMDGYELIRRVRNRAPEQGGRIPAVALTAYARSEDRTRAISTGFQMHIPKPVDPAELITIIASLTGYLENQVPV